ncbi:MAG: sterol desaturase family protein [Rhizobiaceae bacterium]
MHIETFSSELFDFILRTYPGIFRHDLLRYLIGAGGTFLIINLLLSGYLAARKIRPETPGWAQIRREILASFRTVIIFSLSGLSIALLAWNGLADIRADAAEYGWWCFAANVAVLIIAHDAWFYWSHRIMHRPRLFKWFHRLHHRSHNPTPFTSYAFDATEAVVNAAYLPLILLVLPSSIPALLFFTVHMMIRNALGHCGYEVFPARNNGRPLFDWMTTVTHHDLHHAYAGKNFGLYFTFWDRIMGTEHPRYHAEFAKAVAALPARDPDPLPG